MAASRRLMFGLVLLPALWPAVPLFAFGDPSVLADPGEYLLHHYGFFACVLLAFVLMLTPIKVLFPGSEVGRRLQRHRRFFGVATFCFAVIHFSMYILHSGGLGPLGSDWRKPFIAVGLGAFGVLVALALTSTNGVIRRMGRKRWKRLHRFVYAAAILVVYHQISADKVFPMQVVWIFGPVLLLQILRVVRSQVPGTHGRSSGNA